MVKDNLATMRYYSKARRDSPRELKWIIRSLLLLTSNRPLHARFTALSVSRATVLKRLALNKPLPRDLGPTIIRPEPPVLTSFLKLPLILLKQSLYLNILCIISRVLYTMSPYVFTLLFPSLYLLY